MSIKKSVLLILVVVFAATQALIAIRGLTALTALNGVMTFFVMISGVMLVMAYLLAENVELVRKGMIYGMWIMAGYNSLVTFLYSLVDWRAMDENLLVIGLGIVQLMALIYYIVIEPRRQTPSLVRDTAQHTVPNFAIAADEGFDYPTDNEIV